jgi:NAD(P)-dependent dehydrogenase (short-subunit alcohol dehydrogenase family)
MGSLNGRIALITGASRGLGQTVALALAKEGAHVVLVARTEKALIETAEQIRNAGGKSTPFSANVGDVEQVAKLQGRIVAEVGAPLILVNAAGMFGPLQVFKDTDPKEWIETIMVNTIGPYLTCRALVGEMIKQNYGRIINFSSAAALHEPGPMNSAYATSKVALNHFTRHLAAELKGTNVTANVIHPGEVKTAMWADMRDMALEQGDKGKGCMNWVNWVDQTGGDDPQKAADLTLRIIADQSGEKNGKFLWIDSPLQKPIASW